MSRERSEERRPGAAGPGGATGLIRSLGSAVGFVRRLVPVGTGAKPTALPRAAAVGATEAAAGTKRAPAPKPAPTRPSGPTASDRQRAVLEQQIARLEAELERTYSAIAECTVGQSLDPSTATPVLNELIERQRALKDELFTVRLELTRVERFLARERRLQAVPELDETRAAPAAPAAVVPRARPSTRSVGLGAIVAAVRKKAGAPPSTTPADLERLAADLRHQDPDVRREAVARLGEIGGKAAVDLLVGALDDDVERVSVAALHALARSGGRAAQDIFRRFARHDSAQLRLAALRGLATAEGEEARTSLVAALDDEDPTVRRAVAAILGWQHVDVATRPLCFCLRDPDEGVRAAAAAALGDLRDDRAVLSLLRAVADRSPLVADAARAALRAIVGEELEPVGEGLGTAARVAAMRQWWMQTRVALRLERQGLGDEPRPVAAAPPVGQPAAAPAVEPPSVTAAPAPAAAPAAAPPRPERPPAPAKAEPAKAAPPPAEVVTAIEGPGFESLIADEAADAGTGESWTEGGAGTFESLIDEGGGGAGGGAFESLVGDEDGIGELGGDVLPVIEGGAEDKDKDKKGRTPA